MRICVFICVCICVYACHMQHVCVCAFVFVFVYVCVCAFMQSYCSIKGLNMMPFPGLRHFYIFYSSSVAIFFSHTLSSLKESGI